MFYVRVEDILVSVYDGYLDIYDCCSMRFVQRMLNEFIFVDYNEG